MQIGKKATPLCLAVVLLALVGIQTASLGSRAEGSTAPVDENDLLIVVSRSNSETALRLDDVREIFLKEKKTWSDGTPIIAVNASASSHARKVFRETVLRMSEDQETRYWEEAKIRDLKEPPPEFSLTQRAVFSLKGAIGYVLRKDFKEGPTLVLLTVPAPSR